MEIKGQVKVGDEVTNQYGKKGTVAKVTKEEIEITCRGFYQSNSYDVWRKEK
ncbi:MAG: hypothetical protein KAU20_05850 [Nanoarchaeota archaeon]|nr:hypothetical protein [Nanoarchaeota archaeon]